MANETTPQNAGPATAEKRPAWRERVGTWSDDRGTSFFFRLHWFGSWCRGWWAEWYGLLLVVLGVGAALTLVFLPDWLVGNGTVIEQNTVRGTIAQIIGGGALIGGLFLTAKNVRVAEEGKVTDRFSKAVEQLSSENSTLQLGGIYALERIAKDSPKDYNTVLEVLCGFVREKAPAKYSDDGKALAYDPVRERLPNVVLTALAVIVRRRCPEGLAEQPINLSRSRLVGANLSGAQLNWADLSYAQLAGARLFQAQLSATALVEAHLEGADLRYAKLYVARLPSALLVGAYFAGAHLEGAYLGGAHFEGADFVAGPPEDAWLGRPNATYSSLEQFATVTYDDKTKFPPGVREWLEAQKAAQAK